MSAPGGVVARPTSRSEAERTDASAAVVATLTDKSTHLRAHAMGLDSDYERKVLLVSNEIRRMGFGKFQWALTFLCGTGWAVDNVRQKECCCGDGHTLTHPVRRSYLLP